MADEKKKTKAAAPKEEAPSPSADKIPFAVYASMKGIDKSLHKAMLCYPPAAGKESATSIEWDQIFRNF